MLYRDPKTILFDNERIDKLKQIKEDAFVVKNFFSAEDIQYINEQKEKAQQVNKLGSVLNWKYDNIEEFTTWFEGKIKTQLSQNFETHGGNFFKTSLPFFVHTDTGRDEVENLLPYKNIVVPLTQSTKDQPCYTVLFKQRWYGQASMFWKGALFKRSRTDYNHKVEDYTLLENYTDTNISVNEYIRFLTHLPYHNLHGLSIDRVFEWNVGDIIVFDCTQLHSSNDFTSQGSAKSKFALSYFCRIANG